jgi:ADP-heptose:LPS heptosyltransferase
MYEPPFARIDSFFVWATRIFLVLRGYIPPMITRRMVFEWLRGTEHKWREALLRAVVGRSRWRMRAVTPDALRASPHRVLFIREGPLGDLVPTLSAIRAIAESHPGTTVDVIVTDTNVELLSGLSYVARVIPFPQGDRRLVNAAAVVRALAPYDAVVDGMLVHGHVRTRSIAFMLASRARYWVGESGRRTSWVYNVALPPAPDGLLHLERELQLAIPFLDDGASVQRRPMLGVDPAEHAWAERQWRSCGRPGARVLVNISAGSAVRRWPDWRFGEVLEYLRDRDPYAVIVVVGLPQDATSVVELARRVGAIAHVPAMRQMIALVATAQLVISPDTAVCHIASAFGTTLVSLYMDGKEIWWPFTTPGRRVVGAQRENLLGVEVGAVIAALEQLLPYRHAADPAYADVVGPSGMDDAPIEPSVLEPA